MGLNRRNPIDAAVILGGDAGPPTVVDLGLVDPLAPRLRTDVELSGDPADRRGGDADQG